MSSSPRKLAGATAAVACALALVACGEVSTGNFKGESHGVAETVANFQKDATAGDQKKLCDNDLATVLTARLRSERGCQAALKEQLGQVDTLTLTVESVAITGTRAQARVKSIWSGKNRLSTLSLVKEGARWKISGAS